MLSKKICPRNYHYRKYDFTPFPTAAPPAPIKNLVDIAVPAAPADWRRLNAPPVAAPYNNDCAPAATDPAATPPAVNPRAGRTIGAATTATVPPMMYSHIVINL